MRKSTQNDKLGSRPRIGISGVARLLGVTRGTVYNRMKKNLLHLDGIPFRESRTGNLYDMEGVVQRFYPGADSNTVAQIINDFRQKHGRMVK